MLNFKIRSNQSATSIQCTFNRIPESFHWIEHEGLSSDSVSFGTFHFEKGEVSILAFIKKFMTRPRPGLFNDLNTLFEFMPGEIYVEKGTTLGNLNHGNKIGFTNAADATVATSFDNILPGLFARIRSTHLDSSLQELVNSYVFSSRAPWTSHVQRLGRWRHQHRQKVLHFEKLSKAPKLSLMVGLDLTSKVMLRS